DEGCTASLRARQQGLQSSRREGIHAFERLLKEQNARSVNHGGSESQLLLHSVRVIRNHGLGAISELHKIQQLLRTALGCGTVQTIHPAYKFQILGTRQALEKAHTFRYNADLALYLDRIRGEVDAEELHAAGGWRQQAGQNFDGRRFSRAVRPQKAEELSRSHLKIDTVDRSKIPECPGQFLRLNGHFGHRGSHSGLENGMQNSSTTQKERIDITTLEQCQEG